MAVKGSTLFSGQYIYSSGVNSGSPLVISNNSLGFGLYYSEASSSTAQAIGTTLTTIASTTPPAGTYLVLFSCNITASSAAGNTIGLALAIAGANQPDTLRQATPTSGAVGATFQYNSIGFNKIVGVNGSQALTVVVSTSAGTVTITGLNFDVVRIA